MQLEDISASKNELFDLKKKKYPLTITILNNMSNLLHILGAGLRHKARPFF